MFGHCGNDIVFTNGVDEVNVLCDYFVDRARACGISVDIKMDFTHFDNVLEKGIFKFIIILEQIV